MALITICKVNKLAVNPDDISSIRLEQAFGHDTVLHVHMRNGDRHAVKQSQHDSVHATHRELMLATTKVLNLTVGCDTNELAEQIAELQKTIGKPLPPTNR